MNVLTNKISDLETQLENLRFKMNFTFVENSEISKVYLNYKQQMEKLQKLQTRYGMQRYRKSSSIRYLNTKSIAKKAKNST